MRKQWPHNIDMMKPEKASGRENVCYLTSARSVWQCKRTKNSPPMLHKFHHQQDYSFNLTGIVLPQPPKWKQVDHLYEDFKKFKWSCTRVFEGPMSHATDKVKVNMLLLWCGPNREDIYEVSIWIHITSMIWS